MITWGDLAVLAGGLALIGLLLLFS